MDTKNQNPSLEEVINTDNPLKEMIVDYVGKKVKPENDEVTLEMVVGELANEFEELVFSLAEENWIRGYHQAMEDMTEGEKLYQENLQEELDTTQDDKE
tara:strand:+ start:112 stop:408 length:297 start_codon:yes stop_codon:yes gene_type:complete